MTKGFQTVLAASDEERRDLFVGAPIDSAPMSRISRKAFGFAGRSMRSSMNWRPVARACSSKAEPRSPKATA
jgi:hypothetical protein